MRRLLAILTRFLACGALAALPVHPAPILTPLTAPVSFTSYPTRFLVSKVRLRQRLGGDGRRHPAIGRSIGRGGAADNCAEVCTV